MSSNGYWFGDPFPRISTSTIWALHGQQSAVHCLSSKRGRNFPQNRLVFALLRAFCFCRFCSSLWIVWSKLSYDRFQAQAGPCQVYTCFKTWRATPGMDSAPFGNFWLSLRYQFGYWHFHGKIRKHVNDCFSRTVSSFQSLSRDRFWQQVLWSEVRTLGVLGAPVGLLEVPGFTSDKY